MKARSVLFLALLTLAGCYIAFDDDDMLSNYWLYDIPESEFEDLAELHKKIPPENADLDLLERAVHHHTNRVRRNYGLSELRYHPRLLAVARKHSEEMNRLGYVGHTSPIEEHATLELRMKRLGLPASGIAENIAVQFTREIEDDQAFYVRLDTGGTEIIFDSATNTMIDYFTYDEFAGRIVQRWMDSRDHRANVLKPWAVYLGCGGARGTYSNRDCFYFTQNFAKSVR